MYKNILLGFRHGVMNAKKILPQSISAFGAPPGKPPWLTTSAGVFLLVLLLFFAAATFFAGVRLVLFLVAVAAAVFFALLKSMRPNVKAVFPGLFSFFARQLKSRCTDPLVAGGANADTATCKMRKIAMLYLIKDDDDTMISTMDVEVYAYTTRVPWIASS